VEIKGVRQFENLHDLIGADDIQSCSLAPLLSVLNEFVFCFLDEFVEFFS
jgi:hypothetical protein